MNYLNEGLKQLGIVDSGIEEKLESYIGELKLYNAKFDLINTDDHDEIVVKHILDSLSAFPVLKEYFEKNGAYEDKDFVMADIGSGAGLPGIPLAIVFSGIKFVLVERMDKRCNFLNSCISVLGLKNVTVETNQAERLEQNRFNLAVFRAFRPLEKKMMHVLRRILKENGKLFAYKAKSEKIKEEMEALGKNMPVYNAVQLKVPFLTEDSIDGENRERNLVVIEK